MRRLCGLLAAVVVLAQAEAHAAELPLAARTRADAVRVFLAEPRVSRWLDRYRSSEVVTRAERSRAPGVWKVSSVAGAAGVIASGEVSASGEVPVAWVGPQVAWELARGRGVGGAINRPAVWLAFCLFFLIGLGNLRRPLCMQNLDLVALLSLSGYLAFFNAGRVFASAVAAGLSLAYLVGRCGWIGVTRRVTVTSSVAPVWLLIASLVFLGGFRIGLNILSPHTLDVSYAGVIGADRLVSGETPYGNFPTNSLVLPCGPANERGEVSDWIQENGRCETANPLGDTYGPVNYHAYVPGLWLFGWSGRWDSLPAVHFTTIAFDLLAMLGLAAVGWRFGGKRLALTLAFAWAAYPFTQYVVSSNANDSIMAAFLIWGFWAATSPVGRGALGALASWTKLAALIVVPLWLTYPARERHPAFLFAAAFAAATAASFWFVAVGGSPIDDLRVFYERTFQIQAERSSPFSLWDWGDYHAAGIPDLAWLQRALQVTLVIAALAVAVVPRRKTPLQLAALTAALLAAFELALTHWSGTYVVWFFPFALLATYAGTELRRASDEGARDEKREVACRQPGLGDLGELQPGS